jgi:hypothetical protein
MFRILTLLLTVIGMVAKHGPRPGPPGGNNRPNRPRGSTPARDIQAELDAAWGQLSAGTPADSGFDGSGQNPNQRPNAWDADDDMQQARDDMPNLGNLSPSREQHILHGDLDDETSGGHMHGTGRTGKSEFPEGWDEDRIVDTVRDVAQNPDSAPLPRKGGGWEISGQRDGVDITVVVNKDGSIWTAYPTGGIGVTKNP